MAYILDGAAILIFLLAIFLGFRRGFMKSVIHLAGCVVAVVAAALLSTPLAGGAYDLFLANTVEETISSKIVETDEQSVREALSGSLEQLPGPVANALESAGLGSPEQITEKLQSSLGGSADALSETISTAVVRPVAVSLLRMLLFAVLFIVVMILAAIAAAAIDRVCRLPVLRQVNGVLGGVMGALQGALLVFVGVTVLTLVSLVSKNDGAISRQTIEDTHIVRAIETISPVTDELDRLVAEVKAVNP